MSVHTLGGAVCRDYAFVPGTSGMAVGLWSFCIL